MPSRFCARKLALGLAACTDTAYECNVFGLSVLEHIPSTDNDLLRIQQLPVADVAVPLNNNSSAHLPVRHDLHKPKYPCPMLAAVTQGVLYEVAEATARSLSRAPSRKKKPAYYFHSLPPSMLSSTR
jgi:hypothetical protein